MFVFLVIIIVYCYSVMSAIKMHRGSRRPKIDFNLGKIPERGDNDLNLEQ